MQEMVNCHCLTSFKAAGWPRMLVAACHSGMWSSTGGNKLRTDGSDNFVGLEAEASMRGPSANRNASNHNELATRL